MASLDSCVAEDLDAPESCFDDEDALIASLEDDEYAPFASFREQRIQQLHEDCVRAKTRITEGYGVYSEFKEEKELMDLVTKSSLFVAHFAKDDFSRCRIMDTHLKTLAEKHFDTRFAKISAENAPFLVSKMGIKILPCVLCWKDGQIIDRIVGFEGLAHAPDTSITTKDLEDRLLKSGVIQRCKTGNLSGNRQRVQDLKDEESEEFSD